MNLPNSSVSNKKQNKETKQANNNKQTHTHTQKRSKRKEF